MLIAQTLGEYGVAATLIDGIAEISTVLGERLRQVDAGTWAAIVLTSAAVWLLFIRR